MKIVNPLPINDVHIVVTVVAAGEVSTRTHIVTGIERQAVVGGDMTLENVVAYAAGKTASECLRNIAVRLVQKEGFDPGSKEGMLLWRTTARGVPTELYAHAIEAHTDERVPGKDEAPSSNLGGGSISEAEWWDRHAHQPSDDEP